jgi:hypothetical protein
LLRGSARGGDGAREEEDLGALNFNFRKTGAFAETSELVGWLLAS